MGDKIYWTKALSQEFWAGVVSPLMFSVAGGLIEDRMAKKGLRIAGVKLHENEPFLRLVGGQIYLNARILEKVVRRIPSAFVTPQVLDFLPEESRGEISRTRVSLLSPNFLRILLRVIAFERNWAPFSNYKAFDRAVRLIERKRRVPALLNMKDFSQAELLDRTRLLYQEMGDFLDLVVWGVLFAYLTRPLMERLARDWGQDAEGELAACLRVGLDRIKTFEINREIEILADEVESDSSLKELFDSAEPEAILAHLSREGKTTGFGERFRAFLEEHGHRFLGRDIRHATWRERPETLVEMIRMNRGRDLCRKTFELQRQRRTGAEKVLRERVKRGALGLPRKVLFSLLLSYDREYFIVRENMRYFADTYLEQFRRIYLEIGRRWQLEGMIRGREEIVFLRREEIEQAREKGADVLGIVEQRKREYAQACRLRTPEVIRDSEDLSVPLPPVEEERVVLNGEVASPGHETGPARLIREPKDLLGCRKGDILVARCADPSWAPVLPLAAGLVLEVGGLLSHGSIIAREYGIPALIQVEGAVGSLRDGDRLELDTDRRCVRVLSGPLSP